MGSFSQTLFFGEVKRQPEIRLRSQAILIEKWHMQYFVCLSHAGGLKFCDVKKKTTQYNVVFISNFLQLSTARVALGA